MSSVSPPAVLILPAVLFPLRIELRFLVRIPGTIGTTRTCGTLGDKLLGLAVVSILLNRAIIDEYILPVLWKRQLKYSERPIFWYCACSHCDTQKERTIYCCCCHHDEPAEIFESWISLPFLTPTSYKICTIQNKNKNN